MQNNFSFTLQEQTVNIRSLQNNEGLPTIYGVLLFIAGVALIALELILRKNGK